MEFKFDGVVCLVTNIGGGHNDLKIVVPRLVKDGQDFVMNLSDADPQDGIHWVTVYVKKREEDGTIQQKPIHIKCNTREEVISLVDALQVKHAELRKQAHLDRKKPWTKAHRLFMENKNKEKNSEIS